MHRLSHFHSGKAPQLRVVAVTTRATVVLQYRQQDLAALDHRAQVQGSCRNQLERRVELLVAAATATAATLPLQMA